MSATVRDNIVFSYEYDETFYNLVLDGAFHSLEVMEISLITMLYL